MASTTPAVRPRWTATVCGMASYIDAATIVTWSTVLVIRQQTAGLTAEGLGLIAGMLTLGIAIGALVGGRLGDRFGRRTVFLTTMALILVGTASMALADSFAVMLIATVVVGLGAGADLPVSLATIAEAAKDENRGKLLALSQVLWLFGSIVPAVLSSMVGNLGDLAVMILLGHIFVVTALVLIARFTIPESAEWAEARRGQLTAPTDRGAVKSLFTAPYLVPFLALLVFYGLGNAGLNTMGQFSTYLLVNEAGVDVATSAQLGLASLPPAIVAAFLFMKAVDGPRRFLYFTIGAVFMASAMLLPVVFGYTVPVALLMLIILPSAAAFASEGIMKFWSQRSFPTLLRTTAQGSILAAGRFVAALLAVVTPAIIAVDVRLMFMVLFAMFAMSGGVAWLVFRKRDQVNEFVAGREAAAALESTD